MDINRIYYKLQKYQNKLIHGQGDKSLYDAKIQFYQKQLLGGVIEQANRGAFKRKPPTNPPHKDDHTDSENIVDSIVDDIEREIVSLENEYYHKHINIEEIGGRIKSIDTLIQKNPENIYDSRIKNLMPSFNHIKKEYGILTFEPTYAKLSLFQGDSHSAHAARAKNDANHTTYGTVDLMATRLLRKKSYPDPDPTHRGLRDSIESVTEFLERPPNSDYFIKSLSLS